MSVVASDTEKKRNNHFVPRSYLKQWSNNGNTVWCYDTIVPTEHEKVWKSKGVGGLAYWRDFYTQVGEDDSIDDSIETLFGEQYEEPAGYALKTLRDGGVLSSEEMAAIVDFAILQMVRTPAWYGKANRMMLDGFKPATTETLSKLEADYAFGLLDTKSPPKNSAQLSDPAPFPQFDFEVDIDGDAGEITVSMELGRKNYLASLGYALKGNIGNLMRGYSWSVVEMPQGVILPTCDNPFVRCAIGRDGELSLDGGLGVKGTDLFMPLTPRRLLFTEVGNEGVLDSERLVQEPWIVDILVRAIVQNATRYVYDCSRRGEIVQMRPRRVDPEYCSRMADSMRRWNEIQG